jgi:spore maturation protein CgeB
VKPAREWLPELADALPGGHLECTTGRDGMPALKVNGVSYHSRYNPVEEAARLVDSVQLDPERPVLVLGLGLGYHALELARRGADLAVVEPDRGMARLALGGPCSEANFPLALCDAETAGDDPKLGAFLRRMPQVWVHPSAGRVGGGAIEALAAEVSRLALGGQRLRVAVVGPLYGGSLPITEHLVRAFRKLGHVTLYVDNSPAWGLFDTMRGSIERTKPTAQLSDMLVHLLGEWSYARVAEFEPEVCIVMAQAPVGPDFPERIRAQGTVSAFWFIENWRHMGYWKSIAAAYDGFFHIQPGEFEARLEEAGCARHAFIQTGCDPEVHRPADLTPEEARALGCDVSFAGAGYPNRNQVLSGLTDFDLKIWGVDWTAQVLQKHLQNPGERFTPELFAKIVAASKVSLNLHASTTHPGVDPNYDALNPRVFEIAACGGFQLCDPCIGLEQFFDPDTEIPTYRSLPELRERLSHFLGKPDERAAIAERARARALRDHTYEHRARQMLDCLFGWHGQRMLRRGIRVQKTVGELLDDGVVRDDGLAEFMKSLPQDMLFLHETVNAALGGAKYRPDLAGQAFLYLRNLRESAEALIKSHEFAPGSG